MYKNLFNDKEMENIFEIGRIIQGMIEREEIEVEDIKDAFALGLQLALEFEDKCPDTEEYYMDLEEFVLDRITARFGVEA